ncbi:MAG: hypothetical protein II842_16005 [Butyrivibrio sp.]|nr:hypothetical protein [Butyrivibrio sp.]MBQ4458441.1 hypothetical protein [Clostridia bacterium]
MAIVKQTNKNGVTYVYESHSYRDPETKQPRAKRKLIGRIDDATGEIIPTRSKKNITTDKDASVDTKQSVDDASYSSLLETLKERDETIKSLRGEIATLRRERKKLSEELTAMGNRLQK